MLTYNQRQFRFSKFNESLLILFIDFFYFLRSYYILNDIIWQDGFLIDFLQKKIIDKWIRKFVIFSGYLFNERLVFDYVIKFYIFNKIKLISIYKRKWFNYCPLYSIIYIICCFNGT